MRIIALIILFVLVVANLVCNSRHMCPPTAINRKQTMRRRLPPVTVSGGLFNLQQFKSPAYSVYTASGFVAFLGLYTGQFVYVQSLLE